MIRKAIISILGIACSFGLLAIVPRAQADMGDQTAEMTFSKTIQLPGHVTLPAGTYWFMAPGDFGVSPNIVTVTNADRTKVYGTFLTNATTREKATSDSEVEFAEPGQGQPATILRWFYPHHLTGHEFVYEPREESMLSASAKLTVNAREIS